MKKFLGCLGIGCLSVIILCVVLGFMGYNWCATTGRQIMIDGINQVGVEMAKECFDSDSAAEIASLSLELKKDFEDGKMSIVDSFKYCVADNATETATVYSKMLLGVMHRKLCGKISEGDDKNLEDADGAEAVKTVLFGLVNGKVDVEQATRMTAFLTSDKNRGRVAPDGQTKTIRRGITKKDMQYAVDSFKAYIQNNNLEKPGSDFSVDVTVKDAVVNLINNIRTHCKK